MDHNMLRHKELFKEQSMALSPRNHKAMNRELQNETRAKQRNKRFENNRIISLSPTPRKPTPPSQTLALPPSAKENQQPRLTATTETPKAGTSSSTAVVQKQFTRQELYLQRFIQWKAECKKKYQKLKPRVGQQGQVKPAPQAPFGKGSKTFQPPANLPQQDVTSAASLVSRRSLYIVNEPSKPEPPARPNGGRGDAAATHKKPVPMKTRPLATFKPPATSTSKPPLTSSSKPPPVPTVKPPPTSTGKPPLTSAVKSSQPTSTIKSQATSGVRPIAKIPSKKPLPVTNSAPKLPNLMSQPFAKPASSKPTASRTGRTGAQILKPQPIRGGGGGGAGAQGGAAAKFKSKTETKSHVMRANLATRMKPKLTLQGQHTKTLFKEMLHPVVVAEPPQTPLDTSDNPFNPLVTSTHCKSNNTSSVNLLDVTGDAIKHISPVVPTEGDFKAKRQLIAGLKEPEKPPGEEPLKRKFNFVQCESIIESPTLDGETPIKVTNDEETLKEQEQEQQTPPRRSSISNYLSPYVTCSRGKVNSRSEREKRNSMYLQDPETPLEVRLALESSNYFRQQLAQEIERLLGLCQEWEAYCQLHETRLTETGGLDMINVTIGQTKLLTSKKFMQFKGLIERCEAGAKGTQTGPNDGSENSKPVLAKDLEGWWDMLKLQSDNLDKRFGNLRRWRDNDWLDPDARQEIKPKTNLAQTLKANKPKGKASSSLKQFLKNAKLKHKKQAEAEAAAAAETTLASEEPGTPTSRRSCRMIVVRDRKSFSPARTVLRLSRSGESPRSSLASGAGSNHLLKSAIMGATLQHNSPPPAAPVALKSRASILKTPGTIKRESSVSRGVVFSAKKNVRRFKFTFEEGELNKTGGDKLEDCEEDMSVEETVKHIDQESNRNNTNTSRTYSLRNRKINLRPSSEFM